MKVTIEGHEIVDAKIVSVSLVKRGAIRAPFKIIKNVAGSGHLGPEPQPDYARTDIPATAPFKPAGGPYAESGPNPMHEWAPRYVTDRHGAQAAQVANPLNLVEDHSLDALLRHARRQRTR